MLRVDTSASARAARKSASDSAPTVARKIEGADRVGADAHGEGVDRPEACPQGLGGEQRPPLTGVPQVGGGGGLSAAVAVRARAFVALELEEFQEAHPFA